MGTPSLRDRSRAYRKVRALVLRRDGFLCVLCGAGGVPLEVDHIVPLSEGGGDDPVNLRVLCVGCHADRTYGPGDTRAAAWDALVARRWGV